jgi:hypothetical protein
MVHFKATERFAAIRESHVREAADRVAVANAPPEEDFVEDPEAIEEFQPSPPPPTRRAPSYTSVIQATVQSAPLAPGIWNNRIWSHQGVAGGLPPVDIAEEAVARVATKGATILGVLPAEAFRKWWPPVTSMKEVKQGLSVTSGFKAEDTWSRASFALLEIPHGCFFTWQSDMTIGDGMPVPDVIRVQVSVRVLFRKRTLLIAHEATDEAQIKFRVDGLDAADHTARLANLYVFARRILGLSDDAQSGVLAAAEGTAAQDSQALQARVAHQASAYAQVVTRIKEQRAEEERRYWASPEGHAERQRQLEAQWEEEQERLEEEAYAQAQAQEARADAARSKKIRSLHREIQSLEREIAQRQSRPSDTSHHGIARCRARLQIIESELRQLGA